MIARLAIRRPLDERAAVRHPPLPLVAAALAVAALAAIPTVYLILRASSAAPEVIALLVRPRTLEVVASTLALALGVGLGAALLGVPVAWLTTRSDVPGRRAWAVLSVVPLAIPSYVTAFAFIAALGPRGALQALLEPLGVTALPQLYGLPGAVIVLTLATYPYVVLATRAALLRTDARVEEAARSLGDTPRQAFLRAALPLLAPAIAAGVLLAVLYALADFGAVALLRVDSFARAIYVQYRASFDRHAAAGLALMLVATTVLAAALEARIRRRAAVASAGASRRPPARVRLGRWTGPAVALLASVVGAALVLPVITIAFWLLRGLEQGEPLRLLVGPVGGSFAAGVAGAAVCVLLAIPLAVLAARWPGRLAVVVERITYAAYAVPGIALALAVVFLTANAVPFAYQTFAVLVLAYGIRFLAQAVAPMRNALWQIGPHLGEAARGLGRRPLGALVSVTLPLVRPGLVAAAALVFLSTVKELPITLLLAPTGFDTLATEIWDAASEGFFSRAAVPAALLTALSVTTVAVLLRAEDTAR